MLAAISDARSDTALAGTTCIIYVHNRVFGRDPCSTGSRDTKTMSVGIFGCDCCLRGLGITELSKEYTARFELKIVELERICK